jgi:integrase/recombinase XerD
VKCVIDSNVVLARAPEGLLAVYLGPFAKSLQEQGYATQSIHRQVLIAACFSGWLTHRRSALRGISSDLAAEYLRYRARRVRPSRGDAAALKHLLEFLRRVRAIPVEKTARYPTTSAERCVRAYEHHLREARGQFH